MLYRRFGQTDLNLSVFSLGTMRALADSETLLQTLKKAFDLGINHIETAKTYGNSQAYLGPALKDLGYPRESFYLTSKISPTPKSDNFRRFLEESLAQLQVDYLDCLAIHGINQWKHLEWVTQNWSMLEDLRSEGLYRNLGFSTHGPLDLIISAIDSGYFSFVNLHYYYFFQRNKPALLRAQSKDLGVFIISPADKGGLLHHSPELLLQLSDPLTPLELNYLFLLEDPCISTLSIGPATPQEMTIPSSVFEQLAYNSRQAIYSRLESKMKESLGVELCSQCYQCLPCPENINIPEVLRLRNMALAYNMDRFVRYRYAMFENAGHWFPGRKAIHCTECGDCLPRCPERLNIPSLLRDAHLRFGLTNEGGRRLWQNEET